MQGFRSELTHVAHDIHGVCLLPAALLQRRCLAWSLSSLGPARTRLPALVVGGYAVSNVCKDVAGWEKAHLIPDVARAAPSAGLPGSLVTGSYLVLT